MTSTQKWMAEMPSNIALIKYMGKKDIEKNLPANASLSWTLDHLVTKVTVEKSESGRDEWMPLVSDYPFEMSSIGREKFLNHFKRIKETYGVDGHFLISSANNFPADCGIASSASSFAALTEAACQAFDELSGEKKTTFEKAQLSALGSGSSCRSFLPGLVLWSENEVRAVESELKNLNHMVLIVGGGTKKVSSSEAHKRVSESLLFSGRVDRAEKRLQKLLANMSPMNWAAMYEIIWQEFWDMHALFETSSPSFGYFLPDTLSLLNQTREFWQSEGDGPLVTMDAGPNIHLLWREDQEELSRVYFEKNIKNKWTCLSNIKGIGFAKV